MSVDDILIQIGEFGKFQKRTYMLLVLSWIFTFPFMMLSVFILAVPDHRCRIPGLDNDTYDIQGQFHQQLIDRYIPVSSDETKDYDECHLYSFNSSNVQFDNNGVPYNATLVECDSWTYSKEIFETTFITEHNIVCDGNSKKSNAQTIFFAGVLTGSLIFGVISDVIGRRKCLLLTTFLLFGTTLALSWAPNYTAYVIIRFFTGFANVGVFMTAYVAGMELVGPNKRTIVGLVIAIIGTTGELYLVMVSYFLGKWNYTELAVSIPVGLMGLLYLLVPESPRWLASQNRIDEAKEILQKAAKVNKKPFVPKMVDQIANDDTSEKGRIWLLFTSRVLLFRTLILFYNWMVASMTFYGLSLNAGNLYGGYYLNFVIAALVEFPGNTMPLLVINRFGRRKMNFLFWLIGGVACVSTIFPVIFGGKELQSLTTALAMVGKCFVTAAFATLYVYSAELFPTVVRNAGMGGSSASSRIGGMLSPQIAKTATLVGGKIGKVVPLVIFGAAAIVAGFLCLLLPETLNRNLPETIEDGKNFGRDDPKRHSKKSTIHPMVDITRL